MMYLVVAIICLSLGVIVGGVMCASKVAEMVDERDHYESAFWEACDEVVALNQRLAALNSSAAA